MINVSKRFSIKKSKTSSEIEKQNRHYKSILSTTIKRVMNVDNKKDAQSELSKAQKVIDKVAAKGVIHKKSC